MSKRLLSAALIAGLGVAAFAPQTARAGTVTFTGKVLSSTCTVSNATSGTVTVTLPAVQASDFTAQGSHTGLTPFSLSLTGCPTTPSGVEVGAAFSGGSIDSSTGAIQSSGTSNAYVQMTDSSGSAINLSTNPNPVAAVISSTGTATLGYQAQYYQPTAAAITAGTVSASVTYTLTYN